MATVPEMTLAGSVAGLGGGGCLACPTESAGHSAHPRGLRRAGHPPPPSLLSVIMDDSTDESNDGTASAVEPNNEVIEIIDGDAATKTPQNKAPRSGASTPRSGCTTPASGRSTPASAWPIMDRARRSLSVSSTGSSNDGGVPKKGLDESRIPTEEDLEEDNWFYISEFFIMVEKPNEKGNCTYQCLSCLPAIKYIKGNKDSLGPWKNHLRAMHSATGACERLEAARKANSNQNRRKRSPGGTFAVPRGRVDKTQLSMRGFRGLQNAWGSQSLLGPALKRSQESIVDYFVDSMTPLWVSYFLKLFIRYRTIIYRSVLLVPGPTYL